MRPRARHSLRLASIATIVATALCLPRVAGQAPQPQTMPGPIIQEPVGHYEGFSYVAARSRRADADPARATAQFIVTYTGFTPEAQAAFQRAVDIWSGIVQSSVPIRINAEWRFDLPPYVLGAAGALMVIRDFPNAPRANTYYPVALANARAGVDLAAGSEIGATFNGNFDWYLGTDGAAGTRIDFVTVVLHEIGHGLGFFGSLRLEDGVGRWGIGTTPPMPIVFDSFMATGGGRLLTDASAFPNGSALLGSTLISDDVYFSGPMSRSAGSTSPNIFAPTAWMPGSSLSHLDDATYPNGDANSLMTPALGPGEVIHDPGPMAIGMLADLGWSVPGLGQPVTSLPRAPSNVRTSLR